MRRTSGLAVGCAMLALGILATCDISAPSETCEVVRTCGSKTLSSCRLADLYDGRRRYKSSDGRSWSCTCDNSHGGAGGGSGCETAGQEAADWCFSETTGGPSVGGAGGFGGWAGATAGTSGGGGIAGGGTLPGDILNQAGNRVVAAHSTVRVIVSGYAGPLYQLCRGSASAGPGSCRGAAQDVTSNQGYPDVATHDSFCAGETCTITKIYDQSGQGNDLEPAPWGAARQRPANPANAGALPVTVNGHSAYGILIKGGGGLGYRAGCSGCTIQQGNRMAKGDEPQTVYMVTSQNDVTEGCCFDYGNAETSCRDEGSGAAEAIYFGACSLWGTGSGGSPGPWVMADLEDGLYAGWENGQMHSISTNAPLKLDFVTAVLLGDKGERNGGKGRFALYGGDATSGSLETLYDGVRPSLSGYVPMRKQGSIVLGIAGDNSGGGGGRFYEGAVAIGLVPMKGTVDSLQAAIVAAKYGQ
jgi:non-reducing end alpha-L-arabinofuranosidase